MLVLVVEDSPLERCLMEKVITKEFAEVEVVTCTTVEEALHICSETPPDLIVSDIHLEDGNGLDLCKAIRGKSSPCCGIPMLVVSSDPRPLLMRVKAMVEGAYSYLQKPIKVQEFKDRVSDGLTLVGLRRESQMATAKLLAHVQGGAHGH